MYVQSLQWFQVAYFFFIGTKDGLDPPLALCCVFGVGQELRFWKACELAELFCAFRRANTDGDELHPRASQLLIDLPCEGPS